MTTIKHTEAEARETISKVVTETITPFYSKFGFSSEESIVEYLMDPAMAVHDYDDESEPSIAAEKVRSALWSVSGGTTSAYMTCKLFHALGRESELAWLPEEGNYKK